MNRINNVVAKANFLKRSLDVGSLILEGMSSLAKSQRITPKIGTHGGVFHCDEVLACFMLKQLPEYEYGEIIRTRDPQILNTCDIVVDVGAEYNPQNHRYDHHQREFHETLSTVLPDIGVSKNIKLSSAGLIYAHFGQDVIASILKKAKVETPEDSKKYIYLHVYDSFVEEMDAIDNGIPMYPIGDPLYRINTHLSARVHRLNPDDEASNAEIMKCFNKAMDLVGAEFKEVVLEAAKTWWPARIAIQEAVENRAQVYPSGEIILLEQRQPWKDHLACLEREMGIEGRVKFCIFKDKADSWRVQGIPVEPGSFICRVFLRSDWHGVRDEVLSRISGIPDAIFCHSTGFIGGCKSREGAIEMAIKSLQAQDTNE
ncbi:MYG1 exonuclease isoform X2 [Aethina tumida]|uniref:MYG1 exonuclease isoform X2 n=1 Tax=Aethina tumida TaxID=116153 RepID=UPI00096B56AC|nr:MYG1 exonuclease isoform X2 [Aethina tumida]